MTLNAINPEDGAHKLNSDILHGDWYFHTATGQLYVYDRQGVLHGLRSTGVFDKLYNLLRKTDSVKRRKMICDELGLEFIPTDERRFSSTKGYFHSPMVVNLLSRTEA